MISTQLHKFKGNLPQSSDWNICVCDRLLSGGAPVAGSLLLRPRAAPYFYQPTGWRLHHAGLSVVSLPHTQAHPDLPDGVTVAAPQGVHLSLFFSGSPSPSCQTLNILLPGRPFQPPQFPCPGGLWDCNPGDYIVLLLKYFNDWCVFLPSSSLCLSCLLTGFIIFILAINCVLIRLSQLALQQWLTS